MNIYQRLNEVRKAVSYIQKDKEVANRYKAVTHDAVTAAVREHLIAHGVIIVPSLEKAVTVETKMITSKSIPIIRYEATYILGFVNMDEPSDRVEVRIEAHALDEGDKAPGKAASYATKYAMLKLLSIETGDEEEDRKDAKPAPRISPTDGAWDAMSVDMQTRLRDIAEEVKRELRLNAPARAYELLEIEELDAEQKTAIWTLFDSKERATLKRVGEAVRAEKKAKLESGNG